MLTSPRRRVASLLFAVALAACGGSAPGPKEATTTAKPAAPSEIEPYDPTRPWPHVGDTPPEIGANAWALPDAPSTLAALRGKVVLLQFCDLGSEPCTRDFARLRQLHATHAAKGLAIVTLAFADLDDEARAAIAKHGLAWQVGFGDRVLESGDTYNYHQYPAVYLIGRDGKLRWSGLSNEKPDELARAIEAALQEA
jgi:peroxiredoxin